MAVLTHDVAHLAQRLSKVVATPFSLNSLKSQFLALGWLQSDEFEGHWYDFSVAGIPRFTLDIKVQAAMAPVDFWEEGGHDGSRADYDARFHAYREAVELELGPPAKAGVCPDEPKLAFAAWPGTGAAIVLEQSDYDPQFGIQTLVVMQALSAKDEWPALPNIW
ncbi:MAG: hypothetical protein JST54_06455 [Deltaproteobacteria bacterium]|nr:hypothetical protein [Deltaproteobacteria bacterium]